MMALTPWKRTSLAALATCVLLAASAPIASAQYIRPSLSTGDRIRISAPAVLGKVTTGKFLSIEQDTLRMSPSARGAQLAVPFKAIESLELSQGRKRALWSALGATAGLFAGGIVGGHFGGQGDNTGVGALAGFISGAFLGLVTGAVGGALLAPERWEPYPPERF